MTHGPIPMSLLQCAEKRSLIRLLSGHPRVALFISLITSICLEVPALILIRDSDLEGFCTLQSCGLSIM